MLSSPPGAEITPDQRTHAAEPMALENFRNRCVLWLSILSLSSPSVLFSLFFFFFLDSGSLSVTGSSFPVLLLFLLLFRNYAEGAEGGWLVGSCLREGENARMGRGEKRVAKKLCSFQPGALKDLTPSADLQ